MLSKIWQHKMSVIVGDSVFRCEVSEEFATKEGFSSKPEELFLNRRMTISPIEMFLL